MRRSLRYHRTFFRRTAGPWGIGQSAGRSELCESRAAARGPRLLRRGVFLGSAARCGNHGSTASVVARMRVVGHGGCWLSTRHPTWPGRRIRRIRRHRFQPSAVVHRALRRCRRQDRGQLACRQRQGFRSDALVLQTESARPERRGADRMLDLAGCGASGLPEHPLGRVRNGPGRCGQRAHAAPGGLFVRER